MTAACEIYPHPDATERCGQPARFHVRFKPSAIRLACELCAAKAVQLGVRDAQLRALHNLDVPCRHPHGEWDDPGCVLPTVRETPADVATSHEVPA